MYIWWSLLTVKVWLLLLLLFTGNICSIFFILIFLYCKIVLFTVCCFSIYLMAFDYQELKGSLIYLLTYIGDLLLLFSASVQWLLWGSEAALWYWDQGLVSQEHSSSGLGLEAEVENKSRTWVSGRVIKNIQSVVFKSRLCSGCCVNAC